MYPTWLDSARSRGEVHTILIGTQAVRLTDGELDALRTALGAYRDGPSAAEAPGPVPAGDDLMCAYCHGTAKSCNGHGCGGRQNRGWRAARGDGWATGMVPRDPSGACPDPVEHTRPPAVVAPQLHPVGVARFADPAGYEAGLR